MGAASNAATTQQVNPVYCQTLQFANYVKFATPTRQTPGGGPVCYDGTGTASIDLTEVTRFFAGAHSGSFQYRQRPEGSFTDHVIAYRPFTPGQEQDFTSAVDVISLTITR
ncbi:MAG: hypothetical protein ACRDR6_25285 [Pseudonocardiaceae bacterium]